MSSPQDLGPFEYERRRKWNEYAKQARGLEITPEVYHYLRWRGTAAQKLADETGVSVGAALREVDTPDSDFHKGYYRAKNAGFPKRKGDAFDEFLIDLGLRDEGYWWDVGDSPED